MTTATEGSDGRLFAAPDRVGPAPPRVNDLKKLHDMGAPLLDKYAPRRTSLLVRRIRDARSVKGDPLRMNEVTIRRRVPSGDDAAEWAALQRAPHSAALAYGWLDPSAAPPDLVAYVYLDAHLLLEDIEERPGCIVRAAGNRPLHHAPGGAEFYVVDLRRICPDTILTSYGNIRWGTDPAPARQADQESLW